ncbi:hypothetical protein HK104_007696 [Borealophlyctis nickersoniae]|nr:hypothetical protein HK104_007696 [Borealophlyctis nickersoniae]
MSHIQLAHHRLHIIIQDDVNNSVATQILRSTKWEDIPDVSLVVVSADRRGCILCEQSCDFESHSVLPSTDALDQRANTRKTTSLLSEQEKKELEKLYAMKTIPKSTVALVKRLEEYADKGVALSREVSTDSLENFQTIAKLEGDIRDLTARNQLLEEKVQATLPALRDVDSRMLMEKILRDAQVAHDMDPAGCTETLATWVNPQSHQPRYINLLMHFDWGLHH